MADSSLATPAPDTTAATPAPAATQQAQPDPSAQAPVSTDPQVETKGEPPKWRWQDILANARETSAKEAETRVRQEFEGLKDFQGLSADERAGLLTWHRAMRGDSAALAHVSTVARTNPQVAQMLKGLITPEPQAQPAARPESESEPNFVVHGPDGRVAIDVDKLSEWRAWSHRQAVSEAKAFVQQEIAPLKGVAATFHQREAQATYNTTVAGVIAKMKAADPVFEKHTKDVAETLQKDARLLSMALGDDTRAADPETALEIAWSRVYRGVVLPAQQSQTEAQVLANLQRQAVAATTSPATATATTPVTTIGNAEAALAHARAQLGG
jgi:hypothetical protein